MLPWDVWGPGWAPDEPVPADLTMWDRIAALTNGPDHHLDELRTVAGAAGIAVPVTVFNHLRGVPEPVVVA